MHISENEKDKWRHKHLILHAVYKSRLACLEITDMIQSILVLSVEGWYDEKE